VVLEKNISVATGEETLLLFEKHLKWT